MWIDNIGGKENEVEQTIAAFRYSHACMHACSFFEGHIMGPFASHLKFPADPIDFCPKCLASALLGGFKQPKSREEMKTDLRKLVEACGFIPPKDFMSIGRYSSLSEKLPKEKLIEIIPVLIEILPHEIYEMEFGSWLKALIESGVLSDDAKREIYGTRCLAKDGHECLSLAEKIIDDWLYANGISHLKEPFYPKDEVLNPEGNKRGDWKTGDVLIEFFGMVGVPEYERKMQQKRKLAKKTHMNLIEICPDDLYDLSKKLGKLKNPYMQEDTA